MTLDVTWTEIPEQPPRRRFRASVPGWPGQVLQQTLPVNERAMAGAAIGAALALDLEKAAVERNLLRYREQILADTGARVSVRHAQRGTGGTL